MRRTTELAFVIAFLSLKAIKQPSASAAVYESAPVMTLPAGDAIADTPFLAAAPVMPLPQSLAATMRDRIAASVEQQPDVAARLVRAWIKEG